MITLRHKLIGTKTRVTLKVLTPKWHRGQHLQPSQFSSPFPPLQVITWDLKQIIWFTIDMDSLFCWVADNFLIVLATITENQGIWGDIVPIHFCWILHNSGLGKWYLREMAIMVEGIQMVGKEVINEVVEVEEMVRRQGSCATWYRSRLTWGFGSMLRLSR